LRSFREASAEGDSIAIITGAAGRAHHGARCTARRTVEQVDRRLHDRPHQVHEALADRRRPEGHHARIAHVPGDAHRNPDDAGAEDLAHDRDVLQHALDPVERRDDALHVDLPGGDVDLAAPREPERRRVQRAARHVDAAGVE
jgi:hypothetical protein